MKYMGVEIDDSITIPVEGGKLCWNKTCFKIEFQEHQITFCRVPIVKVGDRLLTHGAWFELVKLHRKEKHFRGYAVISYELQFMLLWPLLKSGSTKLPNVVKIKKAIISALVDQLYDLGLADIMDYEKMAMETLSKEYPELFPKPASTRRKITVEGSK